MRQKITSLIKIIKIKLFNQFFLTNFISLKKTTSHGDFTSFFLYVPTHSFFGNATNCFTFVSFYYLDLKFTLIKCTQLYDHYSVTIRPVLSE